MIFIQLIPVSPLQQLEYEYYLHRKQQLPFIKFIDNEKQGLVYDFMINDYKIQEKVGNIPRGKNGASFALFKNNGTQNKKHIHQSYKKGDNDFYWLNVPDKKYFYIIPENELIKHKYIDLETKRNIYLNPNTKDHWSQKYLFDYTKPDIEKIKNLFEL